MIGDCLCESCRAAATALSKRHADGSLPIEDYNIELEDQGGHTVKFGTETDQRYCTLLVGIRNDYLNFHANETVFVFVLVLFHSAAMMGLMLHTKGKSLIGMEMYSDAVEVLAMAEVSCYCW